MRFSASLSHALVAFAILTSSASARPSRHHNNHNNDDLDSLAEQAPSSSLPEAEGLELKYVVLGVGTQNYTCSSSSASVVPGTTGATAKLYDIGTALSRDRYAKYKIPTISALALSLSAVGERPLQVYLQSQDYDNWIGDHYFTGPVPTFSLNRLRKNPKPVALVSKAGAVDAPPLSCPGLKGEGAVPWLLLTDSKNASQGGVNTVYRVETAGGKAPTTCDGQPAAFKVAYATQYWIYGPSD